MIIEGAGNGRFIVVGFDLGHAQTAVATVWADSGEEPAIAKLHNRALGSQVHPTAVARYADQPDSAPYTIVGIRCFNMEEECVASMPDSSGKDVHLAFKSEDIGDGSTARYATELFVARVVQQLTEPNPRSKTPDEYIAIPPGTPARWVFGVPSGWSRATCEAYEELLRRVVTGLHPDHEVEVVPESRAAMLYAQSQRRTRRGGIRVRLPDLGSVLVIDMGSLTTDYTYVANLGESPLDHGSARLGAALIDQQLMLRTIEGHPGQRASQAGHPRRVPACAAGVRLPPSQGKVLQSAAGCSRPPGTSRWARSGYGQAPGSKSRCRCRCRRA